MQLQNLAGHQFGRLQVLQREPKPSVYTKWRCACRCGKVVSVRSSSLTSGGTKSCGCMRSEQLVERNRTHGRSYSPEYRLWGWAKHRAKVGGIPFSLTVHDITIPQTCPILGIVLQPRADGRFGAIDSSPTLDRIDPQFGYTPLNTWVISHRANSIKSGWTLGELRACVAAIENKHTLIAGRAVRLKSHREVTPGTATMQHGRTEPSSQRSENV